jgi:cytidine deaminase
MGPELRELTVDDTELVARATAVIDTNTDGDTGVHTVGAAVRDASGRIHLGVNLYHFTGGPCAELVALGAARAAGARELVGIFAVGDGGRGVIAPCGRDRQVLVDYYPGIRVLVPTPDGVRSVAAPDLLPYAFDWRAAQAAVASSTSPAQPAAAAPGSEPPAASATVGPVT